MVTFLPDPHRARALTNKVRSAVVASVEVLVDRLAAHITLDRDGLRRVIAEIRAVDRVSPEIFAHYHAIIDNIGKGDLEQVAAIIDRLLKARVAVTPIACVHLAPSVIGDALVRQYIANIDDETDIPIGLVPVDGNEFRSAVAAVDRGLQFYADCAPDCAEETRELVSSLLITRHDARLTYFGAASSFNQWGAVAFDMSNVTERMRFVPSLVHESAHLLLFGLAMDEPLLTAAPGRRFQSPLREEPRTMDGVYHATIVCARMHYALGQMLNSGLLSDEEGGFARKAMGFQREAFDAGVTTISRDAELSEVAARMLNQAGVYLAGYDRAA